MLPEPHSPRTGLALSDLQSTSSSDGSSVNNSGSNTYMIGGGVISGLAISSHGSPSWSTRGVGGIGAGLSNSSAMSGGGLKFNSNNQGGGFFGGCSTSSSFSVGPSNQVILLKKRYFKIIKCKIFNSTENLRSLT